MWPRPWPRSPLGMPRARHGLFVDVMYVRTGRQRLTFDKLADYSLHPISEYRVKPSKRATLATRCSHRIYEASYRLPATTCSAGEGKEAVFCSHSHFTRVTALTEAIRRTSRLLLSTE